MVHVSRAKRLGLLFITAGLTLGVGDLAAQAKQANAAQHTPTTPKDAAEPAAVVAQTQANSANSTARQQHPQRKAPTFRQRVWRWVWRFARDPIAVLTLALFGLGGGRSRFPDARPRLSCGRI